MSIEDGSKPDPVPQQRESPPGKADTSSSNGVEFDEEEIDTAAPSGELHLVPEAWDVFISYRIKPDEPLAEAFRDLLEGSVTPKPRIFVASSGGLRPSQTGYKKQIQIAAQDARSFVAIITPSSLDREWLFFEAGAAWGRNQLYAPLLVDTDPSQLPTTIADYQATRCTQDREVEALIESIAEALGRKTRTRFAPRYRAFRRAIDSARQPDLRPDPEADEGDVFKQVLLRALSISHSDKKSALQMFDDLRGKSLDVDQLALLELLVIDVKTRGKGSAAELTRIAKLPEPLRSSPRVLFAQSGCDPSPTVQVSTLEKIIAEAGEDHPIYPAALDRLVTTYVNVGKRVESDLLAQRHLLHARRDLKAVAAAAWARIHVEAPASLRMLLLSWAYSIKQASEVIKAAIELAVDMNWSPLSVYLGRLWQATEPSTDAMFQLGRAYAQAGLSSLAYELHLRAAREGIAVANLNMAALVGRNPIPAAAIQLIEQHNGEWYCDPPAFPFELRAAMIAEVEKERAASEGLYANGGQQFAMLVELADLAASDPGAAAARANQTEVVTLKRAEDRSGLEMLVSGGGNVPAGKLIEMPLIPGLFELRFGHPPTFGMARLDSAGIVALRLDREGKLPASRLLLAVKA